MDGFKSNNVSAYEGFTQVPYFDGAPVYQCVMCFCLVLAAIPVSMPVVVPDPLNHHRNNCAGWQNNNGWRE